ncbi:hypothetical protein Tco_0624727 [Tanacetum coccineum]|uniref:Uncharacterized protein n=1 Tax=Tanacetum coccineum TaxID=301880 RepID=A0ABQ4WET7_9ASTR
MPSTPSGIESSCLRNASISSIRKLLPPKGVKDGERESIIRSEGEAHIKFTNWWTDGDLGSLLITLNNSSRGQSVYPSESRCRQHPGVLIHRVQEMHRSLPLENHFLRRE